MSNRPERLQNSFVPRQILASGIPRGKKRRKALRVETLEQRLVMDAGGLASGDLPEEGDALVAVNDTAPRPLGAHILRIDPLANDLAPAGAGGLTIQSVGASQRGAAITISADGKRLVYNAGDVGLTQDDRFTYTVATADGQVAQAEVFVTAGDPLAFSFHHPRTGSAARRDSYHVLEDSPEQELQLLEKDFNAADAQIVSATAPSHGGTLRIAEDGRSVWYTPEPGNIGRETFRYTIEDADGRLTSATVVINIDKPYQINYRYDNVAVDFGAGSVALDPLADDTHDATPLPPRIDSFHAPEYAGQLTLADGGKRLLYTPADDFIGRFRVDYTVRYGEDDHQIIHASFTVTVQHRFLAVENWFAVDSGDDQVTSLDVLANDPILEQYRYWVPASERTNVTLSIAEVSQGSAGGEIRIADDGAMVLYKPAEDFLGEETFTYTVEASNGVRQTATVTVQVGPIADEPGLDQFRSEAELRQFLIDQAVKRYGQDFGATHRQPFYSYPIETFFLNDVDALDTVAAGRGLDADISETNTQVEGVDEADIVETDGQFVYTFRDGKLVIADLSDLQNPLLVSSTDFDWRFDEMFLQGDRLTLIGRGDAWNNARVVVLELGDRTQPAIVEHTELDGYITAARAIGDRVHLVVNSAVRLPDLERVLFDSGSEADPSDPQVGRNETLQEYLDRVRDELIETALPSYRSLDSSGELLATELLSGGTELYKPIAGSGQITSLVTLDAGDNQPGLLAPATSFVSDHHLKVYVSSESAYVFAYDSLAKETTAHKLTLAEDGSAPLVAAGKFRGELLNQFSADEHDGRLRVAVTETLGGTTRRPVLRNHLFVLEQQGNELAVVGEVTNLAPGERITSARFLGERAFFATVRVNIDPLFAIDLSDPTNPTVQGELKIPGFSGYLHAVGENYLIGVGRDAGRWRGFGDLQVTLFDVSDMRSPRIADQLTLNGFRSARSEALQDHHAISFFAESGVLTLPVSWSEQVKKDMDGDGVLEWLGSVRKSAILTVGVDADPAGDVSLTHTGAIEHDGQARRSLRIDDALVTISSNHIKLNRLEDVEQSISQLYVGKLPVDDEFTTQEDSGQIRLAVLANDLPHGVGQSPTIVEVSEAINASYGYAVGFVATDYHWPLTVPSQSPGTLEIADDGSAILFTPADDFFGTATFTYTTFDLLRGKDQATVTVTVEGTPDAPDAVDDQFQVAIGSDPTVLDVRANDLNVDFKQAPRYWDPWICDCASPVLRLSDSVDLSMQTNSVSAHAADGLSFWPGPTKGLTITELGATDNSGVVELNSWGQLVYQPAAGFEGIERFSYTVTNAAGLTSTATVQVRVGDGPTQAEFFASIPTDAPVAIQLEATREAPERPLNHESKLAGNPSDDLLLTLASNSESAPATDAAFSLASETPLGSDELAETIALTLANDLAIEWSTLGDLR